MLVVVEQIAGELAGTVTFAAYGSRYAEPAGPDEGEFRMLAVRVGGHGRGVGEALVRACAERARGHGLSRLRVSTKREMAVAHRLYGRLGFVRTAEWGWEPMPGTVLLTYAVESAPAAAG